MSRLLDSIRFAAARRANQREVNRQASPVNHDHVVRQRHERNLHITTPRDRRVINLARVGLLAVILAAGILWWQSPVMVPGDTSAGSGEPVAIAPPLPAAMPRQATSSAGDEAIPDIVSTAMQLDRMKLTVDQMQRDHASEREKTAREKASLETTLAQRTAALARAEHSLALLNRELQERGASKEVLTGMLKDESTALERTLDEVDSLQKEKATLLVQVESMQKQKEQETARLKRQQESGKVLEQALAGKSEALAKAEQTLLVLNKQLQENDKNGKALLSNLEDRNRKLEQALDQTDKLQKENATLLYQVESLQLQQGQEKTRLAAQQEQAGVLEKSLADIRAALAKAEQKLLDRAGQLQASDTEASVMTTRLEENKQALAQAARQVDTLQKENATLVYRVESLQRQAEQVETQGLAREKELSGALAEKTAALAKAEKGLLVLNGQLHASTEQQATLEKELAENLAAQKQLQKEYQAERLDLEQKNAALAASLEGAKLDVATLRQESAGLAKQLGSLQQAYEKISAEQKLADNRVKDLQGKEDTRYLRLQDAHREALKMIRDYELKLAELGAERDRTQADYLALQRAFARQSPALAAGTSRPSLPDASVIRPAQGRDGISLRLDTGLDRLKN